MHASTTDAPVGPRCRARPMSPDERRQAIVTAVVPLLLEHGRAVTTRQIASAAGIAEGTIFRVFETKDELVDAALAAAFDPEPMLRQLADIDMEQPLRDRLVALVTVLQRRFSSIFGLMHAVGLVAPPPHPHPAAHEDWRLQARQAMVALVEPDAARLRVAPARVVHLVRLLTFSGTHAEIADHDLLTPEEIVDVVLNGSLVPTAEEPRC